MTNILKKEYKYAVIGASKNENKYGYKIIKSLKERDIFVVPVNPKENEILEIKCFKNVEEINYDINILIFVTQPEISEKIVRNLKKTYKILWFQPGSENLEIENFCTKNKINFITNQCVLISSIN